MQARPVVVGGLLAGALDLTWAVMQSLLQGRSPGRMLQAIASGLLGKAAFEGGAGAMALGVLAHFTIALGAAAVFVLAAGRWPELSRRPLVTGPIYGILVYFAMQLAVLPMSRAPWKPAFLPREVALGILAHVLCVGLPIVWAARLGSGRAASDRSAGAAGT